MLEVETNTYKITSVYITMRDGIRLYTEIYAPVDTTVQYPIMFKRTPYGLRPYTTNKDTENPGSSKYMREEKYIFVYQDVRGCYKSEGKFVDVRPLIQNPQGTQIDESTDAYDSIDWLIKNIANNNGKVGMWGISYPGFYAACALHNAHPALKAVSPQAPVTDWFFDDFHHHGALFLPHSFSFLEWFGQERKQPTTETNKSIISYPQKTSFDFYLHDVGIIKNIDTKFYKGRIPFWKQLIEHPDYDDFWKERNIHPFMRNITPAVLVTGGLFDAEDLYGTVQLYKTIETHNPNTKNYFAFGPWAHGGWAKSTGQSLGDIEFDSKSSPSDFYQKNIELPFFNYFLKGKGTEPKTEAWVYQTGENKFRSFSNWLGVSDISYSMYLLPNNKLSTNIANEDTSKVSFTSDPNNPVPYSQSNSFEMIKEYMVENQKFVASRKDVLNFSTQVFDTSFTIGGNVFADLYVSTNKTDADWVVKIIDVFPDTASVIKMKGFMQLVRSEVIRGRYRYDYSKPQPFVKNKVEKISLELQDVLHTFKPGHKLLVQIHSTWFPLMDTNPQNYIQNIYKDAIEKDFVSAVHSVYTNRKYSSKLTFHVVSNQ